VIFDVTRERKKKKKERKFCFFSSDSQISASQVGTEWFELALF